MLLSTINTWRFFKSRKHTLKITKRPARLYCLRQNTDRLLAYKLSQIAIISLHCAKIVTDQKLLISTELQLKKELGGRYWRILLRLNDNIIMLN